MSKIKKIVAILLIVVTIGCMSVSVFASEVNSVEPRGMICLNCYIGQLISTTTYTGWTRDGERRYCVDMPFGEDLRENRTKMTSLKCNYCGVGNDSSSTETRWVCYGHRSL